MIRLRSFIVALLLVCLNLPLTGILAQAPPDNSPRTLFEKGLYSDAYAAFWPKLTEGDPEAALYALIIRRNGLDGRAPAAPAELSALWNILCSRAEMMRQALSDPAQSKSLPKFTEYAYRTALAQLDYFGPNLGSWPPTMNAPAHSELAKKAIGHLQKIDRNFTPAMNFTSYLDLAADGGGTGQAFNRPLKAAESGDHLAMANLSWLYREGIGTEKNDLRAAHWARRSAEASPPVSRGLNELGFCYESGRGVTADRQEALRWYKQSANQNHPAGQRNLQRLQSKTSSPPALDNELQF